MPTKQYTLRKGQIVGVIVWQAKGASERATATVARVSKFGIELKLSTGATIEIFQSEETPN